MTDIVITEFMDEEAVSSLARDFDVVYDPALVDDRDRLMTMMPGLRALIVRNRTQVREDLLDSSTELEVIGRLGVGLDNIDVAACERRGIVVCPATGANDTAVAEYVIAVSMVLLRPAFLGTAGVLSGTWPREKSIGREISGKTLGLVGYGGIARQTARRAVALGMSVVAFDPYAPSGDPEAEVRRTDQLEGVLEVADVVSLHVPLTDSTRGLIGAAALDRMKQDAVLVNTARGGVVDEIALAERLKAGRLGGAAMDVFEDEPLTEAHAAKFEGVPNLILTPHIGGVTDESNVRVSRVTAENVRRVLEGVVS